MRYNCAAMALGLALTAAAGATGPGTEAGSPEVDPFGIPESSYSALGLRDASYPFDGRSGCFPVGNGVIFAHLGVDGDFNTLRGVTGPGYQTRDSAGRAEYWNAEPWTPLSFTLVKRSADLEDEVWEPVSIDSQSIMPLRGAALVRTVRRSGKLTLYGLAYAVPQGDNIVREFALSGANDPSEYAIQIGTQADTAQGVIAGPTAWLWIGLQEGHWLGPKSGVALPEIRGDTAHFHCEIAAKRDDPTLLPIPPGQPEAAREFTLASWQAWSARTKRFDSGDPLLDDLLLQLPVTIETQRDRASGGVSPLVGYHGYWVRDSLGPLLCYLENGRFDEVKRMLRFHRKACWKLGFCHMLVPLDTDVSAVVEGDWSSVGVEHAEVPSLIVLQHYWYWRATEAAGLRDDDFIREAWPFLARNLEAMPLDAEYGASFHGDETYTQGALYSSFDRPESGALGYPNGYISTDLCSLDNTLLHRAAASALAAMGMQVFKDLPQDAPRGRGIMAALGLATQLDTVIAGYKQGDHYAPAASPVTGQYWPWAFSNISFGMYLPGCDFGSLDYTGNYLWAMQQLWRGDTLPGTTPRSGYHIGHNLGSYLFAATDRCDHATADEVARLLVGEALPEGAWCEVYDGAGQPVPIYGRINRIRPWESGVNYYALAQYLTQRDQLASAYPLQAREAPPAATAPEGTQLLVLTRDGAYRDLVYSDYRLAALREQTCVWDIGWPIEVADLHNALFDARGEIRSPYLYLDRDVKLSDRRTFKTDEFWQGAEMLRLLARYRDKGGVVLEGGDLRPAWALSVQFRSNESGRPPVDAPFDPGLAVGVTGDDGPYTVAIHFAADQRAVIRKLAAEGRLANLDFTTTTRIAAGKELWIPLEPRTWEALQSTTGVFTVTSAGKLREAARFVHRISPSFTPAQRIYQATLDDPPAWVPQARWMAPKLDGRLDEWTGDPAIDLTPTSGHPFSGSFAPDSPFRARLWFAYDRFKLYVAGRVEGAAMQGGEMWGSDRLSLAFDARLDSTPAQYPRGAVGSEQWQADDYWVFLAPFARTDTGKEHPLSWRVGGSSERGEAGWGEEKAGYYGEVDGAKAKVIRSEDGQAYDFEWAIPLSELPFLKPEALSCCGLSVFYTSAGTAPNEIMHLTDWRAPNGGIEWRFWDTSLLYFAP